MSTTKIVDSLLRELWTECERADHFLHMLKAVAKQRDRYLAALQALGQQLSAEDKLKLFNQWENS